ncbi:hypothetical protein L9F63_020202, partial [Diploptera punctata]
KHGGFVDFNAHTRTAGIVQITIVIYIVNKRTSPLPHYISGFENALYQLFLLLAAIVYMCVFVCLVLMTPVPIVIGDLRLLLPIQHPQTQFVNHPAYIRSKATHADLLRNIWYRSSLSANVAKSVYYLISSQTSHNDDFQDLVAFAILVVLHFVSLTLNPRPVASQVNARGSVSANALFAAAKRTENSRRISRERCIDLTGRQSYVLEPSDASPLLHAGAVDVGGCRFRISICLHVRWGLLAGLGCRCHYYMTSRCQDFVNISKIIGFKNSFSTKSDSNMYAY